MKTHCVDSSVNKAVLVCNSKPLEGFWFFNKTTFMVCMNSRHVKELCKNCIKKIQTSLSKTKNINKKAGGL